MNEKIDKPFFRLRHAFATVTDRRYREGNEVA
jgi:hypothetical protein